MVQRRSDPRRGEAGFDPVDALLEERIILIGGSIDDAMAADVVGHLLHLQARDPDAPIAIHINSSGGEAGAGLAIVDAMRSARPQISTLCLGAASSMAALVLAAGAPGQRLAMFHARILLQHPSFAFEGASSGIETLAQEVTASRRRIEELFAALTGQPADRIHEDMERGSYLGALEAQEYGLIDRIVTRRA